MTAITLPTIDNDTIGMKFTIRNRSGVGKVVCPDGRVFTVPNNMVVACQTVRARPTLMELIRAMAGMPTEARFEYKMTLHDPDKGRVITPTTLNEKREPQS